MSLQVLGLTKIFGEQRAVNDVSFTASKGQITGFLGPNGAGKSTTMKIATGYSSATKGDVFLDDINVRQDPLKVKKITGYLPEHNPLYLDMYIREFLGFIGRAYGVKNLKSRVEEMIELIGLSPERNKKIGQLSKGFRQRVGLAQAMIHDPSILILDEPTTGLDPNQIVEIRRVIREISQDKTVILSTHIMQEVEAICDKVVIINQGKIVADDSVDVLKNAKSEKESYKLKFDMAAAVELFEKYECEIINEKELKVSGDQANLRAELLKIIAQNDLPLSSISKSSEQSLEDVFRKLTGKEGGKS